MFHNTYKPKLSPEQLVAKERFAAVNAFTVEADSLRHDYAMGNTTYQDRADAEAAAHERLQERLATVTQLGRAATIPQTVAPRPTTFDKYRRAA